jgi:hypothetical protein
MTGSASAACRYAARDERLVQSLGQAMMQKVDDELILKELTSWPYPSEAIPEKSLHPLQFIMSVSEGGRAWRHHAITIDETGTLCKNVSLVQKSRRTSIERSFLRSVPVLRTL